MVGFITTHGDNYQITVPFMQRASKDWVVASSVFQKSGVIDREVSSYNVEVSANNGKVSAYNDKILAYNEEVSSENEFHPNKANDAFHTCMYARTYKLRTVISFSLIG